MKNHQSISAGGEERDSDGRSVWRSRDAQWRPDRHSDYVALLLSELAQLEIETRPTGGNATASGKDLKVFCALGLAGDLVEAVAGWAIDHTAGLALEGLSFVPLQPSQTKKHPDYLQQRAAVDDHRHERNGGRIKNATDDPRTAWRMMLNLLRSNPGAFPNPLVNQVVKAFEQLNFGRQPTLLTALKSRRKIELDELELQLVAIGHIEYRRACGLKKEAAVDAVRRAYGVSTNTVLSWEKRLRKDRGQLEVSRRIAFAHNSVGNDFRIKLHSDEALANNGSEYKRIRRLSKLTRRA